MMKIKIGITIFAVFAAALMLSPTVFAITTENTVNDKIIYEQLSVEDEQVLNDLIIQLKALGQKLRNDRYVASYYNKLVSSPDLNIIAEKILNAETEEETKALMEEYKIAFNSKPEASRVVNTLQGQLYVEIINVIETDVLYVGGLIGSTGQTTIDSQMSTNLGSPTSKLNTISGTSSGSNPILLPWWYYWDKLEDWIIDMLLRLGGWLEQYPWGAEIIRILGLWYFGP